MRSFVPGVMPGYRKAIGMKNFSIIDHGPEVGSSHQKPWFKEKKIAVLICFSNPYWVFELTMINTDQQYFGRKEFISLGISR